MKIYNEGDNGTVNDDEDKSDDSGEDKETADVPAAGSSA